MVEKKYTKERLDKSYKLFVKPSVDIGFNSLSKNVTERDLINIVFDIGTIERILDRHIVNNCAKALDEEIRIECVTKAETLRESTFNVVRSPPPSEGGHIEKHIKR